MVPTPSLTAEMTPEVPLAASPFWYGQAPSGSASHTSPAALPRYVVKLSVVPESSDLCTGVMTRSGSVASGLSAVIIGSDQLVMSPLKMAASTAGVRLRDSTPSTWNTTAMGEM